MENSEFLTESTWQEIALSDSQVNKLLELKSKLISSEFRVQTESIAEAPASIRVEKLRAAGKWRISIQNCVGVISLGDIQLVIQPKIPQDHFAYIAELSFGIPRVSSESIKLASGINFVELLCSWFLDAVQKVLQLDLVKGYSPVIRQQSVVRGRLIPGPTMRAWSKGNATLTCGFDEYAYDSPINRAIVSAARFIARNASISKNTRKRAALLVLMMPDLQECKLYELSGIDSPRLQIHRLAWELSLQVLKSESRSLNTGDKTMKSFLIYTPDLIEVGLRNLIESELREFGFVVKERRVITGTQLSMTPDIVFYPNKNYWHNGRDIITGDIKYRVSTDTWHRPNLNQSIAFANVFDAAGGFVINFGESKTAPKNLVIDGRTYAQFYWDFKNSDSPLIAMKQMTENLRNWFQQLSQPAK